MTQSRRWIVALLTLVVAAVMAVAVGAQSASGFLGIRVDEDERGVFISEVLAGGGAASAGVQVDDVIVSINGTAVETAGEVVDLVGALAVGDVATLELERNGDPLTIEATLGERPAMAESTPELSNPGFDLPLPDDPRFVSPSALNPGAFNYGNGRLGVVFETITAESAEARGIEQVEGAFIIEVQAGTPAEDAGLQVDDIVTSVNGEPVDEERTLRDRLIAYEPGDVVTLTVLRDGESQDIEVTLAEQMAMDGFEFNMPMLPTPDMMESTPEATAEATPSS